MKPFNFEPLKPGETILLNKKTGLKDSIKVLAQSKKRLHRSRKVIGLMGIIIVGYSWHQLQNEGIAFNNTASAQNQFIITPEKDNNDFIFFNDLKSINLSNESASNGFISFSNLVPLLKNANPESHFNLEKEAITSQITNNTKFNDLLDSQAISEPETKIIEKELLFHTIKRGESLGTIMRSYQFPMNLPHEIVNAAQGENFKNIRAGKQLQFVLNKDTNELEEIHYPYSKLSELIADVKGEVTVNIKDLPYKVETSTAIGDIQNSLFGAASKAGISDNMVMELAEIFGWDIDFVKDLRKGDSFKLIYEQFMHKGNMLKEGGIVAAEFINKGQKFIAIRHIDSDGNIGFYTPDGSSLKGTFLKSPMKFSRISSGFSLKRFHPILKRWKAHKGVDYAARTGTPIRSVANGKVIQRGTKGGYGRTVILSHGGKYTTLYAHMSKYDSKVKRGQHVKQGQIIGYVGSSGLATGPHLHYEFRVNGVHRNPLTYKTPKASAISEKERSKFKVNAERQIIALNEIRSQEDDSNLIAAAINIIHDSINDSTPE